ncbi:MAG: response regulator [Phycisphaerae bacterium]|nr:response regulator [Phycisphaerae bacterium]
MEPNESAEPIVLIIEDDPGHQRMLEILVKRLGCRCECAFDGKAGLAKANTNRYDLIFVDIHIPELDGFMVVRFLRDRGLSTPAIAVTALQLQGIDRSALAAGFNDFLRKPIDQQMVAAILEKHLHIRQPASR